MPTDQHTDKVLTAEEHVWVAEEVDGGAVGVNDFWRCRKCGASGGPVREDRGIPSMPPFLADGSALYLGDNCKVAAGVVSAITSIQAKLAEAERDRDHWRGQYHIASNRATAAESRATTAEAERDRLREVVDKLVAWADKYPSSTIYSEHAIKRIAAEIDAITEAARASLTTDTTGGTR